jgi:uncharacterized protein YndB with AHSA1/START domain
MKKPKAKSKPPAKLPVTAVELRLEIPIAAPQERVWEALVNETSAWWPQSFCTTGKSRFTIEAHLGGRMFEDAGGGEGVVWYNVIGVERPNFLLLFGFMAPPFGGPATSYLRLALASKGSAGTTLEVTDAAFGHLPNYNAGAGWREVFGQGLAAYVEKTVHQPAQR